MAVRLEALRCPSWRRNGRELRPAGCGRALPYEKGRARQARGCEGRSRDREGPSPRGSSL